jgi:hypothetical protein
MTTTIKIQYLGEQEKVQEKISTSFHFYESTTSITYKISKIHGNIQLCMTCTFFSFLFFLLL